ncbi:recombinase family protein [Agromyces aerolatus]|uniref:recombinase family protein n=1 Tax=Agromyces sp. LY-1074 TaxID=3074080 RepID=UPI0028607F49|nr:MULTISPECIES: recombinase family protein [unclassified Agromyces]MDR5699961.1 recombinase family protein [Agromyces sp. LY-1074]MDR5706227.1 recombinase family protein [Agromyces sp. LY-1358]
MANTTNSKHFGYIRVSTTAQNLDRQLDALTSAGIATEDIFSDKISGARQSRPGLDDLLSRVRPGDSITVHSLDRLGRSALHVFQTIADLEERGVSVLSLKESEAALTGATGEFVRKLMVLVAELERNMNAERVAEARAARKARSKTGEQLAGRPRTSRDAKSVAKVLKHKERGMTVAEIVEATGISRASVYRILSEA